MLGSNFDTLWVHFRLPFGSILGSIFELILGDLYSRRMDTCTRKEPTLKTCFSKEREARLILCKLRNTWKNTHWREATCEHEHVSGLDLRHPRPCLASYFVLSKLRSKWKKLPEGNPLESTKALQDEFQKTDRTSTRLSALSHQESIDTAWDLLAQLIWPTYLAWLTCLA